jgi:hypothetical protein
MLGNQALDVLLSCCNGEEFHVWQDIFQLDKWTRSDEDVGMDRFEGIQQVELLVVQGLVQSINEQKANPEAAVDIANDIDQLGLGWFRSFEVVFGVEGLDQGQEAREPLEELSNECR